MLSEVDEKRGTIAAEMRRVEDVDAEMRQLEAARTSLALADWVEAPDSVQPGEWLTLGAWPEEIRRAYQRYDARFKLDQFGELKLRLELDLEDEDVANGSHTHGNERRELDDEKYMCRRDAGINAYEIDESERCFSWKW